MKNFNDLIIYQIYLRSFKDTNNDGIGDFNGVREKLDYLQSLGVNAIWLSPFYQSPNYDNGYDISDYKKVSSEFGTMDDLKRLFVDMRKRDIQIIIDLVVNHTSIHHAWFQEARKSRDNPYHDYYIWAETPPNTWKSVFGGSAWEYNEPTKEYYLHSFAVEQADLNWENSKVRKACKEIVEFWVDFGVDGFRCDVLDFISKDFKRGKMYDGPKLHRYIKELFSGEKLKDIFTIGECQSGKNNIELICGKDRKELSCVFQFDHISLGRKTKYIPAKPNYKKLKNTLVNWQKFTQKRNLNYVLFTDNHDQPYYLSRMGNEKKRYYSATMLCACFYLLKGIPVIYQTQEYGSINPYYNDISYFKDIETLNYYSSHRKSKELLQKINFSSRDNTRRPFAWNSDKKSCFGFSESKCWIAPNTNANKINLQNDVSSKKSVFSFYKSVLSLRNNNEVVRYGDFTDETKNNANCFIYKRKYKNQSLIVVCNFDKKNTISVAEYSNDYTLVLSNYTKRSPFDNNFLPFEVRVYLNKMQTTE